MASYDYASGGFPASPVTNDTLTVNGTSYTYDGSGWKVTGATAQEGTAILSTGETTGTKYLREDGDGTSSWQAVAGGGDMVKISSQEFDGTVTSLTFTDCFSSTYNNYRLIASGVKGGNGYNSLYGEFSSDSGSTWITSYHYSSNTSTVLRLSSGVHTGPSGADQVFVDVLIIGSQNTNEYTNLIGSANSGVAAGGTGTPDPIRTIMRSTTVVDSLRVKLSSGTPASGTVTVYGIT